MVRQLRPCECQTCDVDRESEPAEPRHASKLFEPLAHAGRVVRRPVVWMTKNQIIIACVSGPPNDFEFDGDPPRHRNRPNGPPALRCTKSATGVVASHTDHSSGPIDVAPTKGDQFALTKAGVRRGQIERVGRSPLGGRAERQRGASRPPQEVRASCRGLDPSPWAVYLCDGIGVGPSPAWSRTQRRRGRRSRWFETVFRESPSLELRL